jgi:AcrR family transcriptional regulator
MKDKDRKILDAALKIFSENGYKNSTTRSIASKAGVNESTIFRKFKTKDNLFKSVIKFNFEKISAEVEQCLTDMNYETDDPREKLNHILKSLIKIMNNNYDALHTMIIENNNINPKIELESFTTAISHCIKPIKPQSNDLDLNVFSLTIISFLLFVLFEDIIVTTIDKERVFDEFSEYCARILQI